MKHFIFSILIMVAVMTILPAVSLAAGYTITTSIPGTTIVAGNSASSTSIASYIAAIYKGALALVGFVAFVMIVYWGFVYTLSAGNTSKTTDARAGITQAILGLVLLLAGYLILNFVNPALVNIPEINYVPFITNPRESGRNIGTNPNEGAATCNPALIAGACPGTLVCAPTGGRFACIPPPPPSGGIFCNPALGAGACPGGKTCVRTTTGGGECK